MWPEWNRTPCLSRIHRRQHFKRLHYEPGTVNNEGLPPFPPSANPPLPASHPGLSRFPGIGSACAVEDQNPRNVREIFSLDLSHVSQAVTCATTFDPTVDANMHQHFPSNNQHCRQTLKHLCVVPSFFRTAKAMCIKQSCFQGCQKEGKFKWQHFILSSDLITPVTDKEGSAQICRRKKLVKKSTLGGHCTTSGRSKRSKAGPCPRSSASSAPLDR